MIIVFSGYNPRAVAAFLRTLEHNSLNYSIIAAGYSDPILLTDYKKRVSLIRKNKSLNLDEILQAIENIKDKCETNEPIMIAPSTEALNRFLLENHLLFENAGCIIPLVNQKLYETISDKEAFQNLCQKNGIQTPPLTDFPGQFTEPIVAKPKKYISSDGTAHAPMFILNEKDFQDFQLKYNRNDFLFQKYLDHGRSFYLLCYFTKDGRIYLSSQENLAQQPGGKSIVFARTSDIHKSDTICAPYIRLLKRINFFGLIMIEIRFYQGIYYMIEANPRFWGPSQLFCDAHYNLFECLLQDFGFLDKEPETSFSNDRYYYWSGGISGNVLADNNCNWFYNGPDIMADHFETISASDIYKRMDTINIYYSEKLTALYRQSSKHSGYQILPEALSRFIDSNHISTVSRHEKERMNYIQKHLQIKGKRIADIGGNTGFFSIEAANAGASHIDYYEGNQAHAEFVATACQALGMQDQITVHHEYFLFDNDKNDYDICFCLNVLHHFGDDFGDEKDIKNAKKKIINCLNSLANKCDYLAFQMGFNWKGNKNFCLFDHGTKEELIDFIKQNTAGYWEILSIGIPVRNDEKISYEESDKRNLERDDTLGEFLNRPLFIMHSVKHDE